VQTSCEGIAPFLVTRDDSACVHGMHERVHTHSLCHSQTCHAILPWAARGGKGRGLCCCGTWHPHLLSYSQRSIGVLGHLLSLVALLLWKCCTTVWVSAGHCCRSARSVVQSVGWTVEWLVDDCLKVLTDHFFRPDTRYGLHGMTTV
jgi:hypothetical protein